MFTFTPKHQKLVDACYIHTKLDTQKLSILIHHIDLKPDRIHKITRYLRTKLKSEIKLQSIDVTCDITLAIMHHFHDRTNYECNLIKIVNTGIKHIMKNSVVRYNKLLDIIKMFKKGMITYSGEKEVKKMLVLVTNALNQTRVCCGDSDESSSAYHDTGHNLTGFLFDVLIIVVCINELFNTDFESKYMCVVRAICKFENENCLAHLCRTVNIITVRRFCSILVETASRSGFDCMHVLIEHLEREFLIYVIIESHYCLLTRMESVWEIIEQEQLSKKKKYNPENNVETNGSSEKKDIEEPNDNTKVKSKLDLANKNINDKNNNNEQNNNEQNNNEQNKSVHSNDNKSSRSINVDEITREAQRRTSTNSFNLNLSRDSSARVLFESSPLSVSYICLNDANELQSQNKVINLPKILKQMEHKHNDVFLIFKWTYILIDLGITNQCILEVSQSLFCLLKTVFKQNKRMTRDDFDNLSFDLENYTLTDNKNFILSYLQTYLDKCESSMDILYLFIKKAFQFEYSTNNDKGTTYSIGFQNIILDVTRRCAHQNSLCLDAKFIALLFKISENIRFRDECYMILKNSLALHALEGDNRKAVTFKLRSLYYKNHSNILLRILLILIVIDDLNEKELTIFIILHVTKLKGQLSMVKPYFVQNNMKYLYDKYVSKELEYDVGKDERFYDDVMGANYRLYSHSIKSTINLENLKSKRKSMITRINFLK